MKIIYTLDDFRKVFTPFRNGCHYRAVLYGSTDIGVKLGCFGSFVSLCSGLEKELCNLFKFNDGSIHKLKEILTESSDKQVSFDFDIPQLYKLLAEIEPCKICGGTLFNPKD